MAPVLHSDPSTRSMTSTYILHYVAMFFNLSFHINSQRREDLMGSYICIYLDKFCFMDSRTNKYIATSTCNYVRYFQGLGLDDLRPLVLHLFSNLTSEL